MVFIPLSFMSHRFSQTVKNSPLGPLDRGLGIAFGVVRGLAIVGLAYLAFTYFTPVRQQPGSSYTDGCSCTRPLSCLWS